jgi:hypothetical protein
MAQAVRPIRVRPRRGRPEHVEARSLKRVEDRCWFVGLGRCWSARVMWRAGRVDNVVHLDRRASKCDHAYSDRSLSGHRAPGNTLDGAFPHNTIRRRHALEPAHRSLQHCLEVI